MDTTEVLAGGVFVPVNDTVIDNDDGMTDDAYVNPPDDLFFIEQVVVERM